MGANPVWESVLKRKTKYREQQSKNLMRVPVQLLPNHRFRNRDANNHNTSHTQVPADRSIKLSVQIQKPLTDQIPYFLRLECLNHNHRFIWVVPLWGSILITAALMDIFLILHFRPCYIILLLYYYKCFLIIIKSKDLTNLTVGKAILLACC